MKLFKRENLGLCCKAYGVFMILSLLSVSAIYGGGSLEENGCIKCGLPLTPCSEESMDQCRSENKQTFDINTGEWKDNWSCTGACYKSDSASLIAVCIAWPFPNSCSYDGSVACDGDAQKRDCATVTMYNKGGTSAGKKCANYCTGAWEPVEGEGRHNCS